MKLMVAAVLAMRAGDTLTGDGGCARSLGKWGRDGRGKGEERREERRGEVHRKMTTAPPTHSLLLCFPPSPFTNKRTTKHNRYSGKDENPRILFY